MLELTIGSLPLLFWFQILLHEWSHVLAAEWLEGKQVLGWWPYPHWLGEDGVTPIWRFWKRQPDDKFWWGRYQIFLRHPDLPGEPRHLAPVVPAALTLIIGCNLAVLVHPYLLLWSIPGLLHLLDWMKDWIIEKPHTDGARYKNGSTN